MTLSFKTAYGYDHSTKAFIGIVSAFLDPLASTADEPVYILPANATWIQPEGQLMPLYTHIAFVDDAWLIRPDYDALRTEIERMRCEAEAKIWSVGDTMVQVSERLQSDPQDEALQAELQKFVTLLDKWTQYRQALLRMEKNVETLDVAEINWPEVPDLQ